MCFEVRKELFAWEKLPEFGLYLINGRIHIKTYRIVFLNYDLLKEMPSSLHRENGIDLIDIIRILHCLLCVGKEAHREYWKCPSNT